MLELTSLPSGNSARSHFLSIQQGAGTLNIYGELETVLEMADLNVEIEKDFEVEIVKNDYTIELEPDLSVELD